MVACDVGVFDDAEITGFVDVLLDSGPVYLCTWGPGCERMRDFADLTLVERESKAGLEHPVMTTWHANEELDGAS